MAPGARSAHGVPAAWLRWAELRAAAEVTVSLRNLLVSGWLCGHKSANPVGAARVLPLPAPPLLGFSLHGCLWHRETTRAPPDGDPFSVGAVGRRGRRLRRRLGDTVSSRVGVWEHAGLWQGLRFLTFSPAFLESRGALLLLPFPMGLSSMLYEGSSISSVMV